MTDMPKRRLWQIHLSTAVVLMFVSGGIMWANRIELKGKCYGGEEAYEFNVLETRGYGWPLLYSFQLTGKTEYENGTPYKTSQSDFTWETSSFALAMDVLVAFTLLCTAWHICEYFIRRREARKP